LSGACIFLLLVILRFDEHESTTTGTFHGHHRLSEDEKKRRRSFYRFHAAQHVPLPMLRGELIKLLYCAAFRCSAHGATKGLAEQIMNAHG
jgi:hypothetical protein